MSHRSLLLASLLLFIAAVGPASAASEKAMALRAANDLTAFSPPDAFLSGMFLADEREPAFLFGPVSDFVASRKCPVAWLIEQGEKERIAKPVNPDAPLEYTLYLEEDCPGQVRYDVFVDQSAMTPKQWLQWRQQFHKNKAEGEYGATRDRLEKAVADGLRIGGELRFIMLDGELSLGKTPETCLGPELSFEPSYDLTQGTKLIRACPPERAP